MWTGAGTRGPNDCRLRMWQVENTFQVREAHIASCVTASLGDLGGPEQVVTVRVDTVAVEADQRGRLLFRRWRSHMQNRHGIEKCQWSRHLQPATPCRYPLPL